MPPVLAAVGIGRPDHAARHARVARIAVAPALHRPPAACVGGGGSALPSLQYVWVFGIDVWDAYRGFREARVESLH
jgi:hypothetical protein